MKAGDRYENDPNRRVSSCALRKNARHASHGCGLRNFLRLEANLIPYGAVDVDSLCSGTLICSGV
jgi:hypothetical protein